MFNQVGKLAKGDIGGALTGAVGLVTDTVTQAATLLSGKLDDAVGIICEVLHPERHKPNLKLDTPEYNVNINYDTPKPAYTAPTYPNPAYSAPTYNPPTNYPQPSYGYQAPAAGVPYVNWQAMYTQFSISAGHSQAAYPSTYNAPASWARANNLSYGG